MRRKLAEDRIDSMKDWLIESRQEAIATGFAGWPGEQDRMRPAKKMKLVADAEESLEFQIEFLKEISGSMFDNDDPELTKEPVDDFLASQHLDYSGVPKRSIPAFTVELDCLACINYGYPLVAHVSSLNELDLFELWHSYHYELISVENNRWKKWTRQHIAEIEEQIKDDFAFDGFYPKIKRASGRAGQSGRMAMTWNVECGFH